MTNTVSGNNSQNNFKNFFRSVIFFALTFSFGFAVFYRFSEDSFSERDPAAFRKEIHQIKNFDPSELKDELNKKIDIQTLSNGDKSLRFLNLSSNVCKQYKKIQVQFFAEGVSVAGESPVMTVEADCLPAQDPVELASIVIPVEKLLKQKPANAVFKFDGIQASYKFTSSGDEWPRTWILKSMIFKNESGSEKIVAFDRSVSPNSKITVLEF